MAEKFQMTQRGYEEAVERLKYLQTTKRDEIIARISEARSHGDLSENAEYDAARNEQAANEGEIVELDYKIKNAEIIEESNDISFVHIGTKVTVYDPDFEEEEAYVITGTTECDVANNKISNISPVGKALIGKKVGDVVTIVPENNNASYELKIVKIELANE
jgi:transcription elongation factor GreA